MKKKITNNDQKKDLVQDTVDLKDLQADLKTKLGDGELFEDEGVYYYKPDSDKKLYEVDFDNPHITEDFTTNDEDSDSDDPHIKRTDLVTNDAESCPLSKNKKKKESATNMKKIEKAEDVYSEESDKKKSMVDEDEEKETKDIVEEPEAEPEAKEDMKKEVVKPNIEELKIFIKDLVKESVDDLTKDIREERANVIQKKTKELTDLLQEEPYGFTAEDLEGQSVKDLERMKTIVERSKVYKDFQDAQKRIEDPMEINKEIFETTEDFGNASAGLDVWRSFKKERGF